MVEGTYLEQATDPHVPLRGEMLASGTVLPPPAARAVHARAAGFPDGVADALLNDLRASGLGVLQVDEPLSNDRFAALGLLLGTAMPETDPAVQPHVEDGTILNLVTAHGHTQDVSLQPFATNFLTLHTESSARPADEQPRYIVLMCLEAGDNATAAQTVLVPTAAVQRRLPEGDLALLSRTRYRRSHRGPTIVRGVDGRRVFSFRDFMAQPLEWTHEGDAGEEEVNGAVRRLLAAMYAAGGATGVHWSPGMLVVIDNTFFFHGKTAGAAVVSRQRRHLKRLRILPSA
ncbi:MAG TPA: TauD/TfdA family dioxygenase [Longimicrobium sp.]|nr:TauD/TfdA family dioxygenase [Longimicrobium sp.]